MDPIALQKAPKETSAETQSLTPRRQLRAYQEFVENGKVLLRSLSGNLVEENKAGIVDFSNSARVPLYPEGSSCRTVEEEDGHNKQSNAVGWRDALVIDNFSTSSTKQRPAREPLSLEPLATASSECSPCASVNPKKMNKKRNCQQGRELGYHCNGDGQSDNVHALASVPGKKGTKRKRGAQLHKLSEKRRRDKINKRLQALQELLPNCAKMDKASVLDEAIEYLTSLQIQLQIMSFFAGLYVPSTQMMFPLRMQHIMASRNLAYHPTIAWRLGGTAAGCGALNFFSSPCSGDGTRVDMPMMHQLWHC